MVVRRIILGSFQSPGDNVMLTGAVRDLHVANPGQFETDVRTASDAIWLNNPYITPLREGDAGVRKIDMHYPLVHESNQRPYHFIHGYPQYLEQQLGVKIPVSRFCGDIHLSPEERSAPVPGVELGVGGQFWIIIAGGKYDFTAKWWNPASYQAVVDHFRGKIQFVQCGEAGHWHPPLDGVVNLVGKTDTRGFIRLMHHAAGVVCPVTFAMHLAAAVPTKPGLPKRRPCVVIAGGREPPHWEAYPQHQFLSTVGALECCAEGGCWKSRCQPVGDGDAKDRRDLCVDPVQITSDLRIPRCMELITPEEVIGRIELYYKGGVLKLEGKVEDKTTGFNTASRGRESPDFRGAGEASRDEQGRPAQEIGAVGFSAEDGVNGIRRLSTGVAAEGGQSGREIPAARSAFRCGRGFESDVVEAERAHASLADGTGSVATPSLREGDVIAADSTHSTASRVAKGDGRADKPTPEKMGQTTRWTPELRSAFRCGRGFESDFRAVEAVHGLIVDAPTPQLCDAISSDESDGQVGKPTLHYDDARAGKPTPREIGEAGRWVPGTRSAFRCGRGVPSEEEWKAEGGMQNAEDVRAENAAATGPSPVKGASDVGETVGVREDFGAVDAEQESHGHAVGITSPGNQQDKPGGSREETLMDASQADEGDARADKPTPRNESDVQVGKPTLHCGEGRAGKPVLLGEKGELMNVLINFRHGLGDAVQFGIVLKHLRKHKPDWNVDVAALVGKHTAIQGLCRRVFILDREAAPCCEYQQRMTLDWHECRSAIPGVPSTKAARCLREQFGITPDPGLFTYAIECREEVRVRAREYLLEICGTKSKGLVPWHPQPAEQWTSTGSEATVGACIVAVGEPVQSGSFSNGGGLAGEVSYYIRPIGPGVVANETPETDTGDIEKCDHEEEGADTTAKSRGPDDGGSSDSSRFPAVLIHYEGNTSADRKNLSHELAREVCEVVLKAGFVPVILDWDKRSPLPDGVRIHCPQAGHPLWGASGTGDAEALAALIEASSLFIGVDSGPVHVAGATTTPTIAVWTQHHPIHYFDRADRVLHLVPGDHERLAAGSDALAHFVGNYRHLVYQRLDLELPAIVEKHLTGVDNLANKTFIKQLSVTAFDRRYYDEHKRAGLDYLGFGTWQQQYGRWLVESLGLREKRLIDVGCACGSIARGLLQAGTDVRGVDLCEEMIQLGRQTWSEMAGRLFICDAVNLHLFDDESFDFIHSAQSAEHWKPELVPFILKEFRRIGSAGALFFCCLDTEELFARQGRLIEKEDPTHVCVKPMAWWNEQLRETGWEDCTAEFEPKMQEHRESFLKKYDWDWFVARKV